MIDEPIPYEQIKDELVAAFDYFNRELFAGEVPRCMISYSPCRGRNGHYRRKNLLYAPDLGEQTLEVDEISLNPNLIVLRPLQSTLSTLVHQMARAWRGQRKDAQAWLESAQAARPQPRHWQDDEEEEDSDDEIAQQSEDSVSRNYVDDGYHDRLLADKMLDIGLLPCAEGIPGQRQTGRRIGHAIIVDGAFDLACRRLLDTGFAFSWIGRRISALPDPHAWAQGAAEGEGRDEMASESTEHTQRGASQLTASCRRESLDQVLRQVDHAFSEQGLPEARYSRLIQHLDVTGSVQTSHGRHRKQCPGCKKTCQAPADFELICTVCRRPLIDLDPDSSPRLRRLREVQRYEIGPEHDGQVDLKRIDPERRGRPRKH